jgi:hypothetical protein
MQLDGNGDNQHDEQNQHHINQGCGVHFHHYLGFVGRAESHGHLGNLSFIAKDANPRPDGFAMQQNPCPTGASG